MAERPIDYVGQEVVRLSTTPAWRDGRPGAAPFTLRVYAVATPGGWHVMPGGFCRISSQPDARAISMNSAEVADVWVLADAPVERVTLLAPAGDVRVRRLMGTLPARAADNLFWLGRYLERAEATLRLVRALFTRLVEAHTERHETLDRLRELLIDWGAVAEDFKGTVAQAGLAALCDGEEFGSAVRLIRSARRVASSLRERLSEDFWTVLNSLETRLDGCEADNPAAALDHTQAALDALATLAGLSHENMNRAAGWRFLDTGRRIERGISFQGFHVIDEASPLFGETAGVAEEGAMRFIVTVTGLDGTFGQTIHARHIYHADDIAWNARFVDVLSNTPDGRLQIDYTRFHDIEPLPPGLMKLATRARGL